MARKLANQTNVEVPDSDYPYGRIRDNQGDGLGTPVDESVYGDIHQFFARMLDLGDVPVNDLPDNNYSGFQLFEALLNVIRNQITNQVPFATKVVPIGDWNMDTTDPKAVTHGLPDHKLIRSISIIIRDDTDTTYYVTPVVGSANGISQVGVISISSTDINLSRYATGTFDNAGFDSTSFNRGFVVIEYLRA